MAARRLVTIWGRSRSRSDLTRRRRALASRTVRPIAATSLGPSSSQDGRQSTQPSRLKTYQRSAAQQRSAAPRHSKPQRTAPAPAPADQQAIRTSRPANQHQAQRWPSTTTAQQQRCSAAQQQLSTAQQIVQTARRFAVPVLRCALPHRCTLQSLNCPRNRCRLLSSPSVIVVASSSFAARGRAQLTVTTPPPSAGAQGIAEQAAPPVTPACAGQAVQRCFLSAWPSSPAGARSRCGPTRVRCYAAACSPCPRRFHPSPPAPEGGAYSWLR